jgi:N-acetylmuramoyl-L-alanine amidase
MGKEYIVQQGDYLSKIAQQFGFSDYKEIWNHADNAALKNKRKNPNVLHPGDKLIIPDKEEKQVSASTDKRHKFEVTRSPLKLRLVLEDIYEKPIANAEVELLLDGETFNLTTDGKGKIEKDITPTAEGGFLIIKSQETALNETTLPIRIGHLDPVEEESGQRGRLNNLGYFAGPFEGHSEEDNRQVFLSAMEEFQCDHGLTVDGICGPQTQAKLKDVHGC